MSGDAPPLVMDLQGRMLHEDELERFAEEVLKYEELITQPRNASQSQARKQLGMSFNISDQREMTRQLSRFRQLCINKMRWMIRVSQARYGTGSHALRIAPAWLRRLDRGYGLMINALKMERLHGGPQSAHGARMALTWELYCSVRTVLARGGNAAALLHDSAAVESYARHADLPLDTVHGIWLRVYSAALDKLRLHSRGGDRDGPARPSPLEWRVIDLALLHDTGQTTLAKDSFSNSLEVEAMLQLYKLITEAHNKVDRDKQNALLKPPNVTRNTQNEQTDTTDPTNIGTTANRVNRQDPVPSCSSAASEGTESVAQKYPLLMSQLLQSPPEWESAEIWTMVHAEYNKRGRAASLVTLQRRWYELRLLARRDLLLSFRDPEQRVHPLLLAIVNRFPHVVTSPLALWPRLVRERRVHAREPADDASCAEVSCAEAPAAATPTDVPSTVSMSDVMTDLLDWSDNKPEIIEPDKEVIEIDSDNEADANADNTKENDPNPRLKVIKTEPKDVENTNIPQGNTKTTDDIVKTKESGSSSDKTVNIMMSEIIDKCESDPKVKSEPHEIENHSSANEHTDKQNKSSNSNARLWRLSLKRKLVDNYYKKVPRDCFKDIASKDTNSKAAVSGDSAASASTEVDSYNDSDSDKRSDVGNARNSIDEKLLMLARVVLTPVEHIPEWGKHSRAGAIRCRAFSVRRFAASVHVTARELNACRRYVPVRAGREPPTCQPEAPPPTGASGTGIAPHKMEEMRNIPRAYKAKKRQLSRRLRLPRTWPGGAFWASARNVAQLCVCEPLTVAVRRLAPRPVKKVELADIAEVRMRNSTILTAQVAPISLGPPGVAAEPPADAAEPPAPPPPQRGEAAGGGGRGAEEEGAEGEALPSQEDLMKMIRTLVHPSLAALREAAASARARRDGDAEEAQLRSQRDTSQHLHDDIQNLIDAYDVPDKSKKSAPSKIKKVQSKHKGVINEDDVPLPDAFQEWERQKTLIHKYFSFNNPSRESDAKTQSKKPGPKNRTSKVRASISKVSESSKNKIDLMVISDDEDVSKNCDHLTDDKSTNNSKRPREDSDNTNKRAKLTEDQPTDTTAKNNEDNTSSDSDDYGDRMIIDEGIRDIDDPVFSTGPSTNDRECFTESLSLPTPNTQQEQPNNPRLTIMPVNSVPGLRSDHDMPSNIVYVVKKHKTHKNDEPKKAEINASSTVNSIKLLGDASLTLNTPVTTSISTKLPTYYFIASGKQVKGNPEFNVVSGPPLQKILPKTTPMNEIDTSGSIETLAEQKFTYPTNIIRMTRPGPLSAKYRISTQKALSDKINKLKETPERPFEQISEPQIVEEIDLTDDTDVDHATGPKIVSISSLKNIEKENDVVNPRTDGDDNSNKVDNICEDLFDPTKLPNITSVSEGQMLSLEVGPITTSINKRAYSNTKKVKPESNANNKQSSVNLTFILNKNSPSNKRKEVAETICLDSEASDENETVDCTLIKQERDVDVDASSNDSESRDVDVESEAPLAANADIHKAKSSIDEVLSLVKTEKESPIKSSPFQTTSSKTTPQNKNTSKSLLQPIAQNENSSRSLLKTSFKKSVKSKSLLKTTSRNSETSKGLPKTTSQNLETSNNVLKSTTQNQEPNASSQTKDTDNIPIKITNTTTSKDLLKLSPEELARLLEDDNDEEIIEYAPPQVPQNKVATQSIAPVQKKVQNIAPIKIKKEKQWAKDIQLSKEKALTTQGVVVKQEGGSGSGSVREKGGEQEPPAGLELLLQDVPSVSELRTALPDVICDDVEPSDGGETPYFDSIADLGKRKIDIAEYVSKVTDPEEALLKLDFSEPIWVLAGKYLLLTDENIPCANPAYLSSAGGGGGAVAPYTEIRFPDVRNKQVLNLGLKKGRDVMVCGCAGSGECVLCVSIAGVGGKEAEFEIYKPKFTKLCRKCGVDPERERARIHTIKQRPYRKIGDVPLKYVVIDVRRRCAVCGDDAQFVARPDALVINDKHYEKVRDEPLTYAPVLSVVQAAGACAGLARREAELYVHNLRTARRRRVQYRADAALNAAVRDAVHKLDRDEVDAWYRRRIDNDQR